MQVDPGIFKAYDIRGIYGDNLTEAVAEAVGKGFAKVIQPTTVIIGRDGRVSSPQLRDSLVAGLTAVGVNIIDIGMCSTDMYYYACAEKGLPGIMVTASHNPKEYNGFKMVKKIPELLSGDAGIQDIRQVIETETFPADAQQPGTVETWDVMDGFVQKMLSLINVAKLKPMRVIIDTANGMVGPTLRQLFPHLPQIEMTEMYFEPDGTFPNHGGDPLQAENRAELERRVAAEGFDLGFAFDPDGDRFFCVDAKGRFVSGDFMTALLSEYFLQKQPGAHIVYDLRASHAVPDLIAAAGGTAHYNRVGHAYIKARMMKEDAVFGGEVTGHYYLKDFYYCDSGVAPMLFLLEYLSQSAKPLDELLDELSAKYFISGEINTKGVNAPAVLADLKQKYASQAQQMLEEDGLSLEFEDWHFNVRASNTEPLVRLNLEATTQQQMETKRDEILTIIKSHVEA